MEASEVFIVCKHDWVHAVYTRDVFLSKYKDYLNPDSSGYWDYPITVYKGILDADDMETVMVFVSDVEEML